MDRLQALFLAEGKFHIVVGTVVGKNVAVFAVDGGVYVPFLVKARSGEIEFFEKCGGQLVDVVKIHCLAAEVYDRHFDFNADEALGFAFGRFDVAVIQTAHYFFSCHY